jgi:hypothetical protein
VQLFFWLPTNRRSRLGARSSSMEGLAFDALFEMRRIAEKDSEFHSLTIGQLLSDVMQE